MKTIKSVGEYVILPLNLCTQAPFIYLIIEWAYILVGNQLSAAAQSTWTPNKESYQYLWLVDLYNLPLIQVLGSHPPQTKTAPKVYTEGHSHGTT